MKLSLLLSEINNLKTDNFIDREITGITEDSRIVKEGNIFVCVEGRQSSGYDFIDEAYRLGARAFVCEKDIYVPNHSTLIITKNARKCMAELLSKFYNHPERKMKIIGVTGTKGKTTSTYYIHSLLWSLGIKNVLIGTLGIMNSGTNKCIKTANTTPSAKTVYETLSSSFSEGIRTAVIEASSQSLKDFRLHGIPFYAVGFTSFGADHIGAVEHPTRADYLSSKRSLFTSYGAKHAAVNYDDSYSSYMSSGISNVVRCGTTRGSDVRIKDYSEDCFGSTFSLFGRPVSLRMPGVYNATNAALALSLASIVSGAPAFELTDLLSDVSVPGRFERYDICGRTVIIDYAHNEESFLQVLSLVRRIYSGRIIAVFGSVGDKAELRRKGLARVAERFADFSVITADDTRREPVSEVTHDIYSAFTDKSRAAVVEDREAAVRSAVLRFSDVGDVVLLLGKGHETHIITPDGVKDFSEREILKELRCSRFKQNVASERLVF